MFRLFNNLVKFYFKSVNTLVNSGSEINAIIPGIATKVGLVHRQINDGVQKIDIT